MHLWNADSSQAPNVSQKNIRPWLGRTPARQQSVVGFVRSQGAHDVVTPRALSPDLVLAGNFHAARWPLSILEDLRRDNIPVVAYLHDCHWATGRCAYAKDCVGYLHGCGEQFCPMGEDEYPLSNGQSLRSNWQERREFFAGPDALPMAANSHWTADFFREAFAYRCDVDVVHLGLDTGIFKPKDKESSRLELGLPADGFLVSSERSTCDDPRKNGNSYKNLVRHYEAQP